MNKVVTINVTAYDIREDGMITYCDDTKTKLRFCMLQHAARRTPDFVYRLGYVDAIVDTVTEKGYLGIWDWRLSGSNKYYRTLMPPRVTKLLLAFYERAIQGKNKRMREFSFPVALPYCNDSHLGKSPLQ